MNNILKKIFSDSDNTTPAAHEAPSAEPRTPETIDAEIGACRASVAQLDARLDDALVELRREQNAYDHAMQTFALGQSKREPERGLLQATKSKADALGRVARQQRERVDVLAAELADTTHRAAVESGLRIMPALTAKAENLLVQYENALTTARTAERELFAVLFDEQFGLKQRFVTAELAKEAQRVRGRLRAQAMTVADKLGHAISPRFETDGQFNASVEDAVTAYVLSNPQRRR